MGGLGLLILDFALQEIQAPGMLEHPEATVHFEEGPAWQSTKHHRITISGCCFSAKAKHLPLSNGRSAKFEICFKHARAWACAVNVCSIQMLSHDFCFVLTTFCGTSRVILQKYIASNDALLRPSLKKGAKLSRDMP